MGLKMIVILRLAAGILLAGIVFWAISNLINWMRGSLNNYKIKRNQPRPTEEELRNRRLNNKEEGSQTCDNLFLFMRSSRPYNRLSRCVFLKINKN
jgi:hypothetical protein